MKAIVHELTRTANFLPFLSKNLVPDEAKGAHQPRSARMSPASPLLVSDVPIR